MSSKKSSISCCPLNLQWPLNLKAFRQKRSSQRSEFVKQVRQNSKNVFDDGIEVKVSEVKVNKIKVNEDAGSTSWWWDDVGPSLTNVSTLLDVGSPISSWTSLIQQGIGLPPQKIHGGLVEEPRKQGRLNLKENRTEARSPGGCQETLYWRKNVSGSEWKKDGSIGNSRRRYSRSTLADDRNQFDEEKEHHNHDPQCRLLVLPRNRDVSCYYTGAMFIAAAARGHLDAVVAILDQEEGMADVNCRDYQVVIFLSL